MKRIVLKNASAKNQNQGTVRQNVRSRVENGSIGNPRVSHASEDASLAAVAGCRKACTTSGRRRGLGGGEMWVGVLLCHEGLETGTLVSEGNE